MTLRAEIRCCCNPGKLIGTVPIHEPLQLGRSVTFALISERRAGHLMLSTVHTPRLETLTLEVGKVQRRADGLDARLALKSNDIPEEQFRRIPGFRAANVHAIEDY